MSNHTIEELYLRRSELLEQIRTGKSLYLDDPHCGKVEQELMMVKQLIKSIENEA
jgi:hypothetical protein